MNLPKRHFLKICLNQQPSLPKPESTPKIAKTIRDWPNTNATSKNANSVYTPLNCSIMRVATDIASP